MTIQIGTLCYVDSSCDDLIGFYYHRFVPVPMFPPILSLGGWSSRGNSIASKDPDELIEDTRNFVRNSPGIALAGAAVVGFVVARLVKSGLAKDEDDED